MSLLKDLVNEEKIVKLAAMECFTSCVLTYLNMSGRDPSYFMLDYWNINYQFRTLLSSKDTKQMIIKQLYGIDMSFVKGNEADLRRHVIDGSCVILLCAASRLPYFPTSMLDMESTGFQHSILIFGMNEADSQWLVVDPMVSFIGEVLEQQLTASGRRKDGREELFYYVLDDSHVGYESRLSNESLFAICSTRNLNYFINERTIPDELKFVPKLQASSRQEEWLEWFSNRNGGVRALDRFINDATASGDWPLQVRKSWIERNLLTISSILTIRKKVWESFCSLNVMSVLQEKEGEEQIGRILKDWRNLNVKLLKYKLTSVNSGELTASLLQNVELIRMHENHFLEWLAAASETVLYEHDLEEGEDHATIP